MKRKLITLLAAALLALGASNAFAYFEDYELIRVVYNSTTGVEYATDLGNINTLLTAAGSGPQTVGGGANAFSSIAGLTSGQNANLRVAYIAMDYSASSSTNVWLSSTAATQANVAAQYPNLVSGGLFTFGFNYGANATGASYQTQFTPPTTGDVNSFQANFDATPGTMANYFPTLTGEASLATLASASVAQNLFFWANGDVNGNGTNVLSILTNADGSTTLNATATPVPAAIYLMGSGLLGMVGLRRRAKA